MINSNTYAKSFVDAYFKASTPKERSGLMDRFVELIKENRAVSLVPSILISIEREVTERQQRTTTKVEVARDIQEKAFKNFGEIKISQNSEVIGGFIVRGGGQLIDASVRGSLNRLHQIMIKE